LVCELFAEEKRRQNMLAVSIDIFSGKPNPTFIIQGEEEKAVLKEIALNPKMIARVDRNLEGYKGHEWLGFRGIYIAALSDEIPLDFGIPSQFMLLNGTASEDDKSIEVATKIVKQMPKARYVSARPGDMIDDTRKTDLSKMILDEMMDKLKLSEELRKRIPDLRKQTVPDVELKRETDDDDDDKNTKNKKNKDLKACCNIELCSFNPSFWNNCKTTRQNNNCYNYATNRRTDTFAQPGRASGYYPYSINCTNVTNAALSDGAHIRYDCFPSSEAPRYLVAMVVSPSWGDYHWYRKHSEGFWGHKPGSTNARNTDNSGNVISDPYTCDRGTYTQFCGYFYTCKSMVVN
jgi:DNA-directed RNA polymerase subunit H (RpoH/RPB5)